MSRGRKQVITDLILTDADLKRLNNGYVVFKRANNHAHSIKVVKAQSRKEIAIAKLEAKIKQLKSAVIKEEKKRYTLKNKEFWAKGGNLHKVIAERKANAKVHEEAL